MAQLNFKDLPADVRSRIAKQIWRDAGSAEANLQALLSSARGAVRASTIELNESVDEIEHMLRRHIGAPRRR